MSEVRLGVPKPESLLELHLCGVVAALTISSNFLHFLGFQPISSIFIIGVSKPELQLWSLGIGGFGQNASLTLTNLHLHLPTYRSHLLDRRFHQPLFIVSICVSFKSLTVKHISLYILHPKISSQSLKDLANQVIITKWSHFTDQSVPRAKYLIYSLKFSLNFSWSQVTDQSGPLLALLLKLPHSWPTAGQIMDSEKVSNSYQLFSFQGFLPDLIWSQLFLYFSLFD